jgi:hypothetical protein
MANLASLQRWEKYAPDVGNNRSLPEAERLYVDVCCSLSRLELQAFDAKLQEMHRQRLARAEKGDGTGEEDLNALLVDGYGGALESIVRLVGTHTLGGKPVTTLREYVQAVAPLADGYAVLELVAVVREANSVGGAMQLFSGRRSGGWAGTPVPASAAR